MVKTLTPGRPNLSALRGAFDDIAKESATRHVHGGVTLVTAYVNDLLMAAGVCLSVARRRDFTWSEARKAARAVEIALGVTLEGFGGNANELANAVWAAATLVQSDRTTKRAVKHA